MKETLRVMSDAIVVHNTDFLPIIEFKISEGVR